MKGFDEIQQLWLGQVPEAKVSFETILARVKSDKTALTRKLFWQTAAVGAAILILLCIGFAVVFSTWTTYLALVIMAVCIGYYFVNQLADYRRISNGGHLMSKPQEYIEHLRSFQKQRNRFNTRNYRIYEGCVAIAFALYGIELYFVLPFWTFMGIMVFMMFWFLICHFIFMKQYISNENTRIQEMIDDLERIQHQFE